MKISKWILGMVAFSTLVTACNELQDSTSPHRCGCIAPYPGFIRFQEYADHGHRYFLIGNGYFKALKLDWYRAKSKSDIVPIQTGTDVAAYGTAIVDAEPLYSGLDPSSGEQIAVLDQNHNSVWIQTIQESQDRVANCYSGSNREAGGSPSADSLLIEHPESIWNDSFWITLHLKSDYQFLKFNYAHFKVLAVDGIDAELSGEEQIQTIANKNPEPSSGQHNREVKLQLQQRSPIDYVGTPGRPQFDSLAIDLCEAVDFDQKCILWRNLNRMLLVTAPETH